jgi:hypothetical protein
VYAKFCRIRQQERVSHWYQQVCDLLKLLVLPHVACRSDERSRFIMFCIFIDLSPAQGSFRYTEAADTNTYSHALQHQEIISRVTSSLTDFTCSSANRHLKPQVSHIRAPTISPSLISLSLPPAHTPKHHRTSTTSTHPFNNQTHLPLDHQHADCLEPRERSQASRRPLQGLRNQSQRSAAQRARRHHRTWYETTFPSSTLTSFH